MKQVILILVGILTISVVFANSTWLDDYLNNEKEWDKVDKQMKENPQEVIQQYCSTVSRNIIYLLGLVFLVWLFEPKVKQILFKKFPVGTTPNYKYYITIYKWLGLGLLFLAMYVLYYVRL